MDWTDLIPAEDLTYILGNPPFVGKKEQTKEQKEDMAMVFGKMKGAGSIDLVSAWYRKAADFMLAKPSIRAAFVSTNSITQGEQVGIVWGNLLAQGVKIHFAHRTFQWTNEARGKAAVHCVIIGFGLTDVPEKWIFDYPTTKSEPQPTRAKNINPYLVDSTDVSLQSRRAPICQVPEMIKGNEATDDGHLIMNREEMEQLLAEEPGAKPWVRSFLGGSDFIKGGMRWCLWLEGISPKQLRSMKSVLNRVEQVREYRLGSPKQATREKASSAWLFGENRQPKTGRFIFVPKVSAERRDYLPIAFMDSDVIVNNTVQFIPNSGLYEFGVLTSVMHMAWLRAVGGRMKSDYQYSIGIVYNNFPWPESRDEKRVTAIQTAAQSVLAVRAKYPDSSLADLYDPLAMPLDLLKAHQTLDRVVDAAYGKRKFHSEADRVAFLFSLYQQYTSVLPSATSGSKRRGRLGVAAVGA